jgi:hypothetical protein
LRQNLACPQAKLPGFMGVHRRHRVLNASLG